MYHPFVTVFISCSLFLTLFQSPAVKGKVSLTCNVWQASNQDAFFAVTGHWVEEQSPGDWKLQNTLLGFTLMNTAHDGARLGRALYQIVKHIGIRDKVHVHGLTLPSIAAHILNSIRRLNGSLAIMRAIITPCSATSPLGSIVGNIARTRRSGTQSTTIYGTHPLSSSCDNIASNFEL